MFWVKSWVYYESYPKVSSVHGEKALELALRIWDGRPNLLFNESEKKKKDYKHEFTHLKGGGGS